MRLGEPPIRIDRLSGLSGVTFDEAREGALQVPLGDVLPVIGLRALRANKQASGRRQDRHDLEQLGGVLDAWASKSPRKRRR
ncbi:hypothetical protein [Gemmatimonas sp.]|uniref:hypothetical protein n=1 Tax=Gemmatimonas sp. TaxID=1962908 RepID=UPI00286EA77B|nr:hypothetical protein [Gemmatimonas sp.]